MKCQLFLAHVISFLKIAIPEIKEEKQIPKKIAIILAIISIIIGYILAK
jgi:hypothetical protein